MKNKITDITAREILDSRGNPTVETTIYCGDVSATASVPSGASTGSHEALELRDGNKKRYGGLGVLQVITTIQKKIALLLKGQSVFHQSQLDALMVSADGTANKSNLGANAMLSVSLAASRLAAKLRDEELYQYLAVAYGYTPGRMPKPLCNVINGGVHADSGLDIQEFFLIPQRGSFAQQVEQLHSVIVQLRRQLLAKNYTVGVGDEGGFAPRLGSNEKALRALQQAIAAAKLKIGKDMTLGFDAAASEFYDAAKQTYRFQADHKHFKPASIYKYYQRWIDAYHVTVIEDGCSEDDFCGWQTLTTHLGKSTTLVGDDLFVTNPQRIQTGIIAGIANAVLIKPNQIGTLTETMQAIAMAQKYNYEVVISHRSGETADDFIADLAVAVGAQYIKAGSLARGERLAKYNRLLYIESQLRGKR